MSTIPFQTIDWQSVEKVKQQGETGFSVSQTVQVAGLRLRMVEFSAGYLADHWCEKGHIVHCIEGEFLTELSTGEVIKRSTGETFVVSNDLSSHRSSAANGVKLFIIDGDFLA